MAELLVERAVCNIFPSPNLNYFPMSLLSLHNVP